MSDFRSLCRVCSIESKYVCSDCKEQYYCGYKCQEYDWIEGNHNEICNRSDIGSCAKQDPNAGIISYRSLKFGRKLGEGAFGEVKAGTYNGQKVAIKTIKGKPTPAALKEFREEAQLLANLPKNKHVVRFVGITNYPLVLVTELVDGGGLDSRLKPGNPDVSWNDIFRWAQGILIGIRHLHSHGILHRDLATRNILIDKNGTAKVTDFGLSIRVCSPQGPNLNFQQKTFFRGPYKWMPPESLSNNFFSTKSDVWAYGVTLWEILSRRLPFEFVNIEFVKRHVIANRLRLPMPTKWPDFFKNLLSSCWRTKPYDRPSTDRLILWFKNISELTFSKIRLPAISNREIKKLY